jgi:hypothetical protein
MFSRLEISSALINTKQINICEQLEILNKPQGEDRCALHSLLPMQMLVMPLIKALMKEF